ncbi:MAG TPA: energy transducer TonB [Candidatus Acidoferrum sp.]|nr:energy transducer TonB [Candidatus Acidoferrum sp.]
MPPSWVSSFAYVDGHFRVVGGTYPFWAEKLTPIRGPMSLPPATLRGMTLQGMAYQHDQKGGEIVGIVRLQIKVERDGHVSKIKVLSGDQEFIEDAKSYIKSARFPEMPDIPQLASAERKWDFEVAVFKPKS